MSLKKLTTVYFAGVDNLDDVKNRTYNELFMSGGLIVSDEFILNPDVITLGKYSTLDKESYQDCHRIGKGQSLSTLKLTFVFIYEAELKVSASSVKFTLNKG